MPEVKQDSAFTRLPHVIENLAIIPHDRELLGKDMRVDISRTHVFQQQAVVSTQGGPGPEVNHDRGIRLVSGSDRGINRRPRCVQVVPGQLRPVMRGLHPNDNIRVFTHRMGARIDVEVEGILFAGPHSAICNIDEGQDARLGCLHEASTEVLEVFGTRTPGIDERRDTRTERMRVRDDRRIPTRDTLGPVEVRVDMDMDVDQSRRHRQASGIDNRLSM